MKGMLFRLVFPVILSLITCACGGNGNSLNHFSPVAPLPRNRDSLSKSPHAIYVASSGDNAVIGVDKAGNGSASILVLIQGPHTQLDRPGGIALDNQGNIYVSNFDKSITVYASGSNGDATPIQRIAGDLTGITDIPRQLNVRDHKIYLNTGSSVLVFPSDATGDVHPERLIGIPGVSVDSAEGIAVDDLGAVYVANTAFNQIAVFNADNSNGNPNFTFASHQLDHPRGLAIDPVTQNLFSANFSGTLIFGQACGNTNSFVDPIGGIGIPKAAAVAFDGLGNVFVLDIIDKTIGVFVGSGTAWTQTGSITNSSTGEWNPEDIAAF